MSVAGDYEFLAIDQDTGAVVHGIEPEFEAVTVVADSWAASRSRHRGPRAAGAVRPGLLNMGNKPAP